MRAPTATIKALGEALWLQLLSVTTTTRRVVSAVLRLPPPGPPIWPWRAGRRYTTIYRLDVADIMDCGYHVQLHLDPESQVRFERQLADAVVGEVEFDSLTTHTDTETNMRRAGF